MKLHRLTVAVWAGLLSAGVVAAQDAKPWKPGEGTPPAMSPEEKAEKEAWQRAAKKAAMEAWQKNATPSEGHQKLAGMVGTWDAEITGWPDPTAPPMTSRGTSVNRLVMGGRWVESKFTGDGGFEGLGYMGYDNFKKKYMGTWMDNMSTAVLVSEGTFDSAGKVMTQTSTVDDPMTGKSGTARTVTTVVSPDEHFVESFGPDPSGKEVKQMEIRYRRRK